MNAWVEPPPRKGMGCFAKGCLILLVFTALLVIACCAGIYWGLKNHSALVRGGYWLTRMHMIADSPAAIPRYETSDAEVQVVKERWQNFEAAAREHQPAQIELTANDVNNLIAASPDARGKFFVSIEGNRLRLQMSIALGDFVGQSGYYFNGDVTVQSDGAESLANPRLSSIRVNNQPLPSDFLDWKYRSRRLRDYLSDYQDTWDTGTIEIQDGKLILRSRGE